MRPKRKNRHRFTMTMTIGQAADHLGVSVQTIRFYEREGLLPRLARSAAGYRRIDADSIKRIQFIQHAQDVGFTLREISALLSLRADPDGSCEDVQRYTGEKIAELERRMVKLESMKRTLENLSAMCEGGLPATACPILEALDANQSTTRR